MESLARAGGRGARADTGMAVAAAVLGGCRLSCIRRTPPLREDRKGGASQASAPLCGGLWLCGGGDAIAALRCPVWLEPPGWRGGSTAHEVGGAGGGGAPAPPQLQAGRRRAGGAAFRSRGGTSTLRADAPERTRSGHCRSLEQVPELSAAPGAEAAPHTWSDRGAQNSAEDATVRLGLRAGSGLSLDPATASPDSSAGVGGRLQPPTPHTRTHTHAQR